MRLLFFILPMPGKIAVILLSTVAVGTRSVPSAVILLPSLLFPFVVWKVLLAADISHLLWGLKPFFLIPGYLIGRQLSLVFFKHYPMFNLRDLFILLILICVGFTQFQGLDYWSGSGAFGARSTMGFRGFGELSIVAFFIGMSIYFPVLMIFALFSASKLVILSGLVGLLAALCYGKRYSFIYLFILLIGFFVVVLIFSNEVELYAKAISSALYYSILDCGFDCSSFSNRFEALADQWSAVKSSAYILTGSMESDVFVVQPEIAILYYVKLYGIFGVVPFIFILHSTKYSRWGFLLLSVLTLDVYSFSMIGYFMIGFILSNVDNITNSMLRKKGYP